MQAYKNPRNQSQAVCSTAHYKGIDQKWVVETNKQLIYYSLLLTPSETKKEVALGLTFEHHLLARPSLATVEMYKQK